MATRIAARDRLGRIRALLARSRNRRQQATATHDMALALERWEGEGGARLPPPADERLWGKATRRILEQFGWPRHPPPQAGEQPGIPS